MRLKAGFVVLFAAVFGFTGACLISAQQDEDEHCRVCRENLQKLHAAFMQYREDNDGYFPPIMDAGGRLWGSLIAPYLDDGSTATRAGSTFICPASGSRPGGAYPYVDYGYNRCGLGGNRPEDARRQPARIVPNPSETLLLVDCNATTQPRNGWYEAYPGGSFEYCRHDGKANVLFVDGSIRSMTREELMTGPAATNNAPWFGDLTLKSTQLRLEELEGGAGGR